MNSDSDAALLVASALPDLNP
jgi:hypothetical protein